jgi:hypothetical protein
MQSESQGNLAPLHPAPAFLFTRLSRRRPAEEPAGPVAPVAVAAAVPGVIGRWLPGDNAAEALPTSTSEASLTDLGSSGRDAGMFDVPMLERDEPLLYGVPQCDSPRSPTDLLAPPASRRKLDHVLFV